MAVADSATLFAVRFYCNFLSCPCLTSLVPSQPSCSQGHTYIGSCVKHSYTELLTKCNYLRVILIIIMMISSVIIKQTCIIVCFLLGHIRIILSNNNISSCNSSFHDFDGYAVLCLL